MSNKIIKCWFKAMYFFSTYFVFAPFGSTIWIILNKEQYCNVIKKNCCQKNQIRLYYLMFHHDKEVRLFPLLSDTSDIIDSN